MERCFVHLFATFVNFIALYRVINSQRELVVRHQTKKLAHFSYLKSSCHTTSTKACVMAPAKIDLVAK